MLSQHIPFLYKQTEKMKKHEIELSETFFLLLEGNICVDENAL
jgi:hypothetical protein